MPDSIQRVRRHRPAERGQGLVEYALILVLVAVVVIVILSLLGPQIGDIFGRINCELKYRSSYRSDYQWSLVWDAGSYDRLLQANGLPPGGYDGSQNGCYGWVPGGDLSTAVGPLE